MTTLIEWLEDFVQQIENPEMPDSNSDLQRMYYCGGYDTQIAIAQKLRYALEQEKNAA